MGVTKIPATKAPVGGNIVADPRYLPVTLTMADGSADETCYIKTGTSSIYALDSETAWNALPGGVGAKSTAAMTADTYITIAALTGGPGLLYSIIGNRPYSSATSTFKITRDGVEYIIELVIPTYARPIIGPVLAGTVSTSSTAALTGLVGQIGDALCDGFGEDSFGQKSVSYLPHPLEQAAFGLPILGFEDNLKIEVKSTAVRNSGQGDYCAAFYRQF